MKVLSIPKDFKGVVDRRLKKDPTIQFYEWVLSQTNKSVEDLSKVHVSEVMMTPATGKALFELQFKSIKKELKKLCTDKKIEREASYYWLAYGPNETFFGDDFKVYLTKDWYK